jgi:hypothetical protein
VKNCILLLPIFHFSAKFLAWKWSCLVGPLIKIFWLRHCTPGSPTCRSQVHSLANQDLICRWWCHYTKRHGSFKLYQAPRQRWFINNRYKNLDEDRHRDHDHTEQTRNRITGVIGSKRSKISNSRRNLAVVRFNGAPDWCLGGGRQRKRRCNTATAMGNIGPSDGPVDSHGYLQATWSHQSAGAPGSHILVPPVGGPRVYPAPPSAVPAKPRGQSGKKVQEEQ